MRVVGHSGNYLVDLNVCVCVSMWGGGGGGGQLWST